MNQIKSFGYIPALDGIRAISILLVFISHQGFGKIVPGGLGVTIFFFLSGFLITNLLYAEYRSTSRIDLKNFYMRRLLRLYPAMLLMILMIVAFLAITQTPFDKKELFAALFYYENYYKVFLKETDTAFRILWSLAVEEHFYLVFPFLFLALIKNEKLFFAVTAFLILLSLGLRLYTIHTYGLNYFSRNATYSLTHNRFDSILFGCFSSMFINSAQRKAYLKFTASYFVYALAVLMLLFSLVYRSEFFRQTFRYSLQGISFMVLLPPVVYSVRYGRLNNLFSNKALVFIGKISYSIYLFHFVSTQVFEHFGYSRGTLFSITGNVVLTTVLSLISYYGVEVKFNNLRKKFGANLRAAEKPPQTKWVDTQATAPVA